ncbi:GntR family transcriptional regulator [Streptomyces fimicarius]|uniref:GntR family transcriptional regulator n=1 Tax=Streptomyces TaxID=1883 RepID=UPI0010C17A91|nr:GntR family transcriptional regulator [Streptomyces sp. BPSDS2]
MPPRRPARPSVASTLEKRVFDLLNAEILSLRLGPGEHIVTEAVAEALGVSRLPVREALRSLAGRGLVELHAHRGAFIPRLGPEDLDQIVETVEARARLEPWAAERAAAFHDAEQLAALDRALAQGFDALERRARPDANRAHREFLRVLTLMSGHATLIEVLEPLQYRTMLAFVSIVMTTEPEGWASHRVLRDAVADRDGAAASAEMSRHLAEVLDALRLPGNVVPSAMDRAAGGRGGRRPASNRLRALRLDEGETGDAGSAAPGPGSVPAADR